MPGGHKTLHHHLSSGIVSDSSLMFRGLAESVPQLVWTALPDGRMDYANRRWIEFTGLEVPSPKCGPSAEGGPWERVVHPNELHECLRHWNHALEQQKTQQFEVRLRNCAGEYRWFHIRVEPVFQAKHQLVSWIITATELPAAPNFIAPKTAMVGETELSFQAIADNITQLVWLRNAAGETLWFNRRWQDYTGMSCEQMQGWGWQRVHHPDHHARALETFRESLATGRPWDDLFPLRGADGTYRWFLTRAVPIRDEQGNVTLWFGTNTDVTEQHEAEAALRESEHFTNRLLENLFAFVGVLTIDGTLIKANRGPLGSLEIAAADNVGKKLWECRWWGDSSFVQDKLRDAVRRAAQEEVVRDDMEIEIDSGRRRWIDLQVAPLHDAQGNVTHLVASAVDVSKRKQAEGKLQASEERFRHLADTMPQLVWTATNDGVVDYYNSQVVRYSGIQPSLSGRWNWQTVVHEADLERTLQAWKHSVATGETYQCEHRVQMADGCFRWHLSRARRADSSEGPHWFGTATDVHELKESERERQALAEELRQVAARLEEANHRKDIFLATLAHELRNPLAPIKSAAQLMRMPSPEAHDCYEFSNMIERQVDQMVRLIDDLLDVSRISRGQLKLQTKPCDLREVIRGAVEAAQPFITTSKQSLTVENCPAPIMVDGDAARLTQVVVNLLNNAAKYTPPGGEIWLTVRREKKTAVIDVRDTGVGLASHQLGLVFDMFTQVNPSQERGPSGLGIGLSLVKTLVQLHHGSVWGHSEGPDRGSTFSIRLPLLKMARPQREPSSDLRAIPLPIFPTSKSFRVLVVEDVRAIRTMMVRVLQRLGHVVAEAEDGCQGLEMAKSFQPDIIFSDICMPVMAGHEMARRLRADPSTKDMLLIALTGYGQDSDCRETLQAGFDDHLVKPVDVKVLARIFEKLSERPGVP